MLAERGEEGVLRLRRKEGWLRAVREVGIGAMIALVLRSRASINEEVELGLALRAATAS